MIDAAITPWRIAVVGPGALGCLFGARLALAGHHVSMLARRPEHAALLNQNGLMIEGDGPRERVSVTADVDPARLGRVDLAIVFVKSSDTASAATSLPVLLGSGGVALSLQNGLGNVEAIAAAVGEDRTLGGATSQGATLLGPGHVRHAGFGSSTLGPACGGKSETASIVCALLAGAGFPAEVSESVTSVIWGKLVANAAINPLGALLRCTNGALLDRPSSANLVAGLAQEAAAVAHAEGISLPYSDPVEHARSVCRVTNANRCSMLQDVEAGRMTEIEAINGAIARLGRRHGVPTPLNETVAELIRALEPAP